MKFKSDKQRKAVMASIGGNNSRTRGVPPSVKATRSKSIYLVKENKTSCGGYMFKSKNKAFDFKNNNKPNYMVVKITKKGVPSTKKRLSNTKDSDGDGVVDSKDCEPFNPKKQGKLHDLQIAILKRKEQKLEDQRVKVEAMLESRKETLQLKTSIANKKLSMKQSKLKQKQAVINEIKREKDKIRALKSANTQAKREIFNMSTTGKVVNNSSAAITKTQTYLSSPSTKRRVNSFLKKIQKLAN